MVMEFERRSTIWYYMEISLWKGIWASRKTYKAIKDVRLFAICVYLYVSRWLTLYLKLCIIKLLQQVCEMLDM